MWTLPSLQFPLENYLEHAACDSSLPVRVEADSEQLAGSIEWTQFSVCAISKITWLFLTCPCGGPQEVEALVAFLGLCFSPPLTQSSPCSSGANVIC